MLCIETEIPAEEKLKEFLSENLNRFLLTVIKVGITVIYVLFKFSNQRIFVSKMNIDV